MFEAAAAVAEAVAPSAAVTGDVIGGEAVTGNPVTEQNQQVSAPPARPEWLAERDARFWDAEKGTVDPAKLYESYTHAQSLIGRRFGDLSDSAKKQLVDILRPEVEDGLKTALKGELQGDEEWLKTILETRLPKAPEAYEPPASLAERKIALDTEHPVWKSAVEVGKKHNLSQEALADMIGLLPDVLEGYMIPPIEDRVSAFGPDFQPRAEAAVNIARSVALRAAGNDATAKQTNGAFINAMLAELRSPEAIKGLELLTKATGEKPLPGAVPAPVTTVTRESLEALMNDKRYWSDRDRDPSFVRQVEEGFKRLYPNDRL